MNNESGDIPTEDPAQGGRRSTRSQLIVNTGDGKGKSTAAFGIMLRALARDWNVAVVQFLKSGEWKVGEEKMGRRLGVDWWSVGDGFTWDSADLTEDEAVAQAGWSHARDVINAAEHQVVILDEVTYPMNWGWIDSDEVIATLAERNAGVNVVATGRDAPSGLVEIADTVSEVRKVKHAFDNGVLARKGLDY